MQNHDFNYHDKDNEISHNNIKPLTFKSEVISFLNLSLYKTVENIAPIIQKHHTNIIATKKIIPKSLQHKFHQTAKSIQTI
jgi:aminopeptidase C